MKNRNGLSEKQIKALLTRLQDSQEQYPPDLLQNRRASFLLQVPPAGFIIGSKAIYKTILRGIQSSAAGATKMILLSVIGMTLVGTMLVGYNQGWARFISNEITAIETKVNPSQLVETMPASGLEKTMAAVSLVETISPTQTPTITPTGTFTPTPTPISTFTPTPAPDDNPIHEPNINPTEPPTVEPTEPPTVEPTDPPIIEPTEIPDDDHHDNGNHYGQTPHPTKPPHTH